MNRYTIYCTEQQVKKAIELDAPMLYNPDKHNNRIIYNNQYLEIPTAEQMIGWLETKDLSICVRKDILDYWYSEVENKDHYCEQDCFTTRKGATLNAIDKALDILEEIKNN